jgi:hypothetical protein
MSEFNSPIKDINARKIQRYFRKNKILKKNNEFLKLNLSSKGKSCEFEDFTKYLRNKEVTNCTDEYIKTFKSYKSDFKLNSKVLLTAYLINYYSEELLGKEQHPMDKGISEWSEEVVKRIADLNNSKEIDKIWLLLNNYHIIFSQWKTSDKSRMIESIIISYYNRSKHIEKIHADEKLNDAEKKAVIDVLEQQRQQVVGNIKFIDPEFNVEYFLENYEEVYNNMNSAYKHLAAQIGNTMKKAYYDMLHEEIKSGNMLPIAEIMTEISKRLLIIVPEKRREKFAEKINVNVIVDLISDKCWTNELIEYLKFICESVFMLGAPCDDEQNKKWLNEVNTLMESEYEKNLPLILIQIEEKLDRIYELINDFSQNQKK